MSDQKVSRRTQIIEASIDLFATNGFWNTPTSKITKHAGVSTGTLFNYFDSKDDLIDEVYLQLREEQSAHMLSDFPVKGTVKERFEHSWFRYIDWGVKNQVRYRLLMQMKLSDLVSSEAQARSDANLSVAAVAFEDAMNEGTFGEISAEYIGKLMLSQLGAAVEFAIEQALVDMPLTKHIARSFEIFWSGATG